MAARLEHFFLIGINLSFSRSVPSMAHMVLRIFQTILLIIASSFLLNLVSIRAAAVLFQAICPHYNGCFAIYQ